LKIDYLCEKILPLNHENTRKQKRITKQESKNTVCFIVSVLAVFGAV
jgi:hypothetical protein